MWTNGSYTFRLPPLEHFRPDLLPFVHTVNTILLFSQLMHTNTSSGWCCQGCRHHYRRQWNNNTRICSSNGLNWKHETCTYIVHRTPSTDAQATSVLALIWNRQFSISHRHILERKLSFHLNSNETRNVGKFERKTQTKYCPLKNEFFIISTLEACRWCNVKMTAEIQSRDSYKVHV